MLQKAHTLLRNGKNMKIGYLETHKRLETHTLLEGLPNCQKLLLNRLLGTVVKENFSVFFSSGSDSFVSEDSPF